MKNIICIPYSPCGGKFKNGKELRYALRGFAKHFKGDYEVVLVGPKKPEWYQGTWIEQTHGKLKTALKLAAEVYPDGFFWWYDDCVLIQDQTAEQLKVTPARKSWGRIWTKWGEGLEKIKVRLEKEGYTPWDYSKPHGPYWFDKGMIDESFNDWPNMAGKFPFESWILSKRDHPRRFGVEAQYYNEFRNAPSAEKIFVNWCDRGFTPELIAWLDQQFPNDDHKEISNMSFEEVSHSSSEEIGNMNNEESLKVEVHTIRFGDAWWVEFCGVTLDAWCSKHSHRLRIWTEEDINPEYPSAKFCEVDMLKEFLSGTSEWMLYVDADVYVSDDAPRLFDIPSGGGFLIHNDNVCKLNKNWGAWCRNRWGSKADICAEWKYKNAGVWACDRKAAEKMLAVIEKPYYERVQEQHHWNWWMCLAHSQGMVVHDLPEEWNSFTWRKEKAAFHHIAGKSKYRKVQALREAGLIPKDENQNQNQNQNVTMEQEQKYQFNKTFNFEPYRFALQGPIYHPMDEYHIHLLHSACNLNAGQPTGSKVAVEIGSFNGASTSALIEAVNKGWLHHLHIVELKPNATLRKVLSMCIYPERVTLHTRPYWETEIGYADIVFIDGDHRWPAVGDTLRALTWESAVICMHDTGPCPTFNCWGSVMAGNMLKQVESRVYFEECKARDNMVTERGFLVSAPKGTDLSSIILNTCELVG